MNSNYIVNIVEHSDPYTTHMVRVLAARNVDAAKIKALAWYFDLDLDEDKIELDEGGWADHTITAMIEDDIPTTY